MRGLRQSLVAVVFTSLFACTVVSAERVQTPAERAEFIATTLRQTPRWWQVPQTDVKERARITDIYVKLAHYPNEDLRAGINLLLDESWPRSMMDRLNPTGAIDKVFAFLRVVFDVPPTLDRADRLYQTFGNPIVGETAEAIDFLWPYTIDRHGKLRLTGTLGMYMGQPPDLTEEFDTMARTLNRRLPPTAEYMAHLEQHEPFQQGYERHKSECAKIGNVALITRTTPDGNPASFTCVSPTDPRYRAQHVMEQTHPHGPRASASGSHWARYRRGHKSDWWSSERADNRWRRCVRMGEYDFTLCAAHDPLGQGSNLSVFHPALYGPCHQDNQAVCVDREARRVLDLPWKARCSAVSLINLAAASHQYLERAMPQTGNPRRRWRGPRRTDCVRYEH
jgi:hypothetical protein